MNKVKKWLADFKQSYDAAYLSLLRFIGLVPEEEPQGLGNYHYELTFETSGEPVVSDCCEGHSELGSSGMDAYGLKDQNVPGLAVEGLSFVFSEDFEGVEEALKPVRKARKKASKKKLVKKKKPTKKKNK